MADDIKKRLSEARQRHEKREADAKAKSELLELEALELCDRLEKEKGWTLDEAFLVHVTPFGVFALKHIDTAAALYKRFIAKKDPNIEDAEEFVRPCLEYPSVDKFNEIIAARPPIVIDLALKLVRLFGAKEATERGKF